eukprot:1161301-Pelagomonas_calceolata.AAC.13
MTSSLARCLDKGKKGQFIIQGGIDMSNKKSQNNADTNLSSNGLLELPRATSENRELYEQHCVPAINP